MHTSTANAVLYASWFDNNMPGQLAIYSGSCSNLHTVYTSAFVANGDFNNQFVLNLPAGDYYIAITGATGTKFTLNNAEALAMSCTSTPCNLAPNPGFEDHQPLTGQFAWGQFTAWVNCWANGSSNQTTTPDYALHPNANCGGMGTKCIGQGFDVWPLNIGGNNVANAHLLIADLNGQNRREYILTELQQGGNNTTLLPNRTYYVGLDARENELLGHYNDALGVMFTQTPYFESTNSIYNPPTTNDQLYFSFTGQGTLYNGSNWRNVGVIFTNTNTAKERLVIGNFENNATTFAATQNLLGNPNATIAGTPLAGTYIDNVEVLEMPTAGANISACAGSTVTLGYSPACLPAGITYVWRNANGTVIGNGQTKNVTVQNTPQTYTLTITYKNASFVSTVTVSPNSSSLLSITKLNQTLCNGNYAFKINSYDPANNTYTVALNGINATVNIAANGLVTLTGVTFTGTTGIATATITSSVPGICFSTETVELYDCCDNQTKGVAVYGGNFSSYFTGGSGVDYIIYGSVQLDDNFHFDHCNFYIQPDAELVALPDFDIRFDDCRFSSCNNYKWDRIYAYDPTTRLTFNNCNLTEALRANHLTNNVVASFNSCTFNDNTISQLIEGFTNGSSLSWSNNFFYQIPLNYITVQHPLSAININAMASLPGTVTSIKFNNVVNANVSFDNFFWSDHSATNDPYHHIWVTNSSAVQVRGNTFNEGNNMYVDNQSTITVIDNYFQKSNQPNGAPSGVFAKQSSVYIGQNGGTFSNNFLDGSSVTCEDPTRTEILNNYFDQSGSLAAISVYASFPISNLTNSSYVKIQHNEIHNNRGILVMNIVTDWQGYSLANPPTNRVVINYNDIYVSAITNPGNSGWDDFGIQANGCHGISIGENDITFNYPISSYIPKKLNPATKACGIVIEDSRNTFVGCNTIKFAGKGLDLRGDVTKDAWNNYATNGFPPNFQVNNFASCFYGIYVDTYATIPHFGEYSLAADNVWTTLPGAPVNTFRRLKDARPTGSPNRQYYYSGNTSSNTYPGQNGAVIPASTPNPNNCTPAPPPNNKQAAEAKLSGLKVYPNPTQGWLNYLVENTQAEGTDYKLEIIDVNGQVIYMNATTASEGLIDVSMLAGGVYLLRVTNGAEVYVQRFICF